MVTALSSQRIRPSSYAGVLAWLIVCTSWCQCSQSCLLSRGLRSEDEQPGDLFLRVERDARLHGAGLVTQRDVDNRVIADPPHERLALAEAFERADHARDGGQRVAAHLVGEGGQNLRVE